VSIGDPSRPERALMCAVLDDAIRCLRGRGYPPIQREQLAREACAWFRDPDRSWPFSFENLCMLLGFDAERLRARLVGAEFRLPPPSAMRRRRPPRVPKGDSEVARAVVQMVWDGQPLRVIAKTLGLSVSTASQISGSLASRLKAERNVEIRRLRAAGWTCRDLGARFGLSRIRILRICARREPDEGLSTPPEHSHEAGPRQCVAPGESP